MTERLVCGHFYTIAIKFIRQKKGYDSQGKITSKKLYHHYIE